jgi:uncharacterized protein (DUF58 family)
VSYRPDPVRVSLSALYRLAVSSESGFSGDSQGRRAGASVEFMDHRRYVPGDNPRWLDWRAYARTDQLLIKRYREEVRPVVEVWIDGSASMAVCPQKAQFALDLGVFLGEVAAAQGHKARVTELGGRSWPPGTLVELSYDGKRPLADLLEEAMGRQRPGALVILVSDFLSPHDARRLVGLFAARGCRLACVQVLSKEDSAPTFSGKLELEDPETGQVAELDVDESVRAAYLRRLGALQSALRDACLQAGGLMAELHAGRGFESHCGRELVRAGLLVHASAS